MALGEVGWSVQIPGGEQSGRLTVNPLGSGRGIARTRELFSARGCGRSAGLGASARVSATRALAGFAAMVVDRVVWVGIDRARAANLAKPGSHSAGP